MHSSARLDHMNLMQDAPNVVSEDGLRTLLAKGQAEEVAEKLAKSIKYVLG